MISCHQLWITECVEFKGYFNLHLHLDLAIFMFLYLFNNFIILYFPIWFKGETKFSVTQYVHPVTVPTEPATTEHILVRNILIYFFLFFSFLDNVMLSYGTYTDFLIWSVILWLYINDFISTSLIVVMRKVRQWSNLK